DYYCAIGHISGVLF
nr:immunoglobulin light chain junction region [Macaca mulatta]MOX82735.1 immunoglobulin light chain junction region [Macaca mulatta]MOX83566.1 immunoglobulin light chain junction region [Macaca mulatta]